MPNKFYLLIFIGILGFASAPSLVEAAVCVQHDVFGWAYSENIGLVSFSCENETPLGAGIDYGVDINDSTGEFSGYAWSENIGWLSFNSADLVGCPVGVCEAKVDLRNCPSDKCPVSGWAKVLSSNGWFRLRDTSYGVYIDKNTKEFHDWAWSEHLGWLSFNCVEGGDCEISDYKVTANTSFPPEKPFNLSVPLGENAYCWSYSGYCGKVIPKFTWDSEPGQTGYEIWLDKDDSSVSEPVEFKHEADYAGPTDPPHSFVLNPVWGYELEFGETYYWKVRTKDNGANWSEWSDIGSFATDAHAWPCPDFIPNPLSPAVDQVVHFIQDGVYPYEDYESICYPGGVGQGCDGISTAYSWDFGNGEFSTEKGNTTTTYSVSGVFYTIRLEITHDLKTCACERDVSIGLPFPVWIEIKPH
jgi:hypothetical protein